jgi:3-hydroxy-9,10-secoandrosta-1,3,5(10)-triene-9,17-dione monooxygenase reductase component
VAGLKLITDPAGGLASPAEFKDAMSGFASGVVLVTCRVADRPWGTTVTSFASVSAEPPTVLVSLGSKSQSAEAIEATLGFGVSFLAEEQVALARRGSAAGAPKFLEPFLDVEREHGSLVVAGALAHLDCALVRRVEIADHTVFFGHVRRAWAATPSAPLLYHGRGYRTLARHDHHETERSTRWLAN